MYTVVKGSMAFATPKGWRKVRGQGVASHWSFPGGIHVGFWGGPFIIAEKCKLVNDDQIQPDILGVSHPWQPKHLFKFLFKESNPAFGFIFTRIHTHVYLHVVYTWYILSCLRCHISSVIMMNYDHSNDTDHIYNTNNDNDNDNDNNPD